MSFYGSMSDGPQPNRHFAIPPYRAEMVGPRWAGVMNAQGINCLTFMARPGAVISDFETCQAIAKQWNELGESAHPNSHPG